MAPAVIDLGFDPYLRLGGLAVRWETVALAAIMVTCVALAAILAGRELDPEVDGKPSRLRRDDLLFILLGVVPGAIVGGRLGYTLTHLDFYLQHPGAWLDPGQGSMELSVGLLGGVAAGVAVAVVLASPVGRWLRVATIPLLLAIGLGKLAMALDASGQGLPSTLPWATAYVGPGPWASLSASIPAHPAQVYEGLLTLVVTALIGGLLFVGRFPRRDGSVFLAGIALWALARVEAGFLWQDPVVLGPFRAAQILGLAIAAASLGLFVWRSLAFEQQAGPQFAAAPEPIAGTMRILMSISPIEADGPPERVVPERRTAATGQTAASDLAALVAAHELLRGREAAALALETGTAMTLAAIPTGAAASRAAVPWYRTARPAFDEVPPSRSGWLSQVRPPGEPPDVESFPAGGGAMSRQVRRPTWPSLGAARPPSWVGAEARARERAAGRLDEQSPT